MNLDYSVDRERWAKLSIFDQMGNIYSEVGRSFKAKLAHDQEDYNQALVRTIDLFDATAITWAKRHSPRTKEVLRAKEEFLRACVSSRVKDMQSLDRYFLQFAIAARLSR